MKRAKENSNGITLIALVVTIVILLILAGITITTLFGENGLITTAKLADQKTQEGAQNDLDAIDEYNRQLSELINGTGGNTEQPDPPTPEEPETLESLMTKAATKNETVLDKYGNPITIPQGFKVVSPTEDSTVIYAYDKENGTSTQKPVVQDGIVIKDSAGNQFVWIPVGEIKNDATENTTNKTTITLGRYTFDVGEYNYSNGTWGGTGEEHLVQAAYTNTNPTNYINTDGTVGVIYSCFSELSIKRTGVASDGSDGLNSTAKDLAEFVNSVKANGGYYIARYEASYGSGYNDKEETDELKYANAKPLSKPSISTGGATNYQVGTVWAGISQPNASRVAKNMYAEYKDINGDEVGVFSDLMNSYAWDTAIVFIQHCSNYPAYSKQKPNSTEDVVCNVCEMASGIGEWSTEFSNSKVNNKTYPCVTVGSTTSPGGYPASRRSGLPSGAEQALNSFRTTLIIRDYES